MKTIEEIVWKKNRTYKYAITINCGSFKYCANIEIYLLLQVYSKILNQNINIVYNFIEFYFIVTY